ncbi:phosphotransferase family protein [Actinoplanes aureus]|uniref:Aminoglycoside phosphotransferase family protein n=1 Tax=Actinoplanes aureus TaxID=2792083 RepID=A0A931G0N2_9ACTN|nr:aminoglycoside phosphotransferase family protein [Actinoplanes aureus]MBG0566968.1 aminoglycoside phosphotransferase family protein [Actinoplanes aureus]
MTTEVDDLAGHLHRRGLTTSRDVQVRPLAGGVSNDVVAVTAPDLDAVVKRALGRLRVAEEWLADPARLTTEGRALQTAGRLLPGAVPRVYDLADGYLVIERAPDTWRTWKQDLLNGAVDTRVAARLGRALGTWQRRTAGDAAIAREFADRTAFDQLRTDPFHRTVAARHPGLADVVNHTTAVMQESTVCLVHGDYTPKNVLVEPGGDGAWVIDWEVAHLGDPTFDPAWTIGHLLLKTVHRPAATQGYAAAARTFLDSWAAELAGAVRIDAAQLVRQTGCLLLARVDGKSPAAYLTETDRQRTRALARRLLSDPPPTTLDAWELIA